MRASAYPSFQSGNVPTLGEYGTQPDFYNLDGKDYSIDSDGTVYVSVNGQWVVDPNMTSVVTKVEQAAPGAVQQAVSNSDGFSFQSILNNLSSVVTTVVQAQAQRDLLKVNLDRASKGLPALSAQQYMPGVNVGVSGDTQKMVLIVAGVLGGALVLSSLAKRR